MVLQSVERIDTCTRIANQRKTVASLETGTAPHRIASQILLMMEQVQKTQKAIAALKAEGDKSDSSLQSSAGKPPKV